MQSGLVSVIMAAYNSSAHIAESIESVLAQTYTELELLITDDCSTDETVEIVKSYAARDGRVHLFQLKENLGAGVARNKSIHEARGRYIAFCDSDDTWLPEKLEKQMEFIRGNGYCFVFSSYYFCNAEGRRTGVFVAPESVSLVDTKRDDKIGFLTALYDTDFYGKFYMPRLRKRQDWAYVLLILQRCGRAYALREPLACYRRQRGSISYNKLSLIRYNASVYHAVFGYSWLKSYAYLFCLFLPTYAVKVVRSRLKNRRYREGCTECAQ